MSASGHTKFHEANFPNINEPNDESKRKGGESLNKTEQNKCERTQMQIWECKEHARSDSNASQSVNYLRDVTQIGYDGTRLREQ